MPAYAAEIRRAVAHAHKLEPAALLSGNRCRAVAYPRQEAIAFTRALTGYTTTRIAREFHCDHSTVVYACASVEVRLAACPGAAACQVAIKDKLRNRLESLARDVQPKH
jgi:chromosomal replication initiation ATPase DnaA